ncbi:transporter substrate-binding domain-containing protein [Shimazuella kribbensis]|uniref:transporter substrate-binding domain-containing protein n=1 Tax=Shimazuella kribbensis TaxID=139808 RepID=UPI00040CFDC9|nr:transporter substrate-binding domain-containing protein [Shimazuella kribbensis]
MIKKRRKLLGLTLLAMLSLFILSACGAKTDTLEQIKSKKVINIAIEGAYPPYNFMDSKNKLAGFDPEISQEIGKRLGVKVNLVQTPWDSMIPGLIANKYDIIVSDMAITEERKKKVDFSNPYFVTGNQLFVMNDSSLTPEQMKGKAIGVTLSTTAADMATQAGADIKLYKNDFLAFSDMINGRLEGVATDRGVGAQIIKTKKYNAKGVGKLLNTEQAGITIRKGDDKLKAEINRIIDEIMKDGTYAKISQKWFGTDISGK